MNSGISQWSFSFSLQQLLEHQLDLEIQPSPQQSRVSTRTSASFSILAHRAPSATVTSIFRNFPLMDGEREDLAFQKGKIESLLFRFLYLPSKLSILNS